MNKKKTTKATVIRLDPDLHKQLRVLAIGMGTTMNELIGKAVRQFLKQPPLQRLPKLTKS